MPEFLTKLPGLATRPVDEPDVSRAVARYGVRLLLLCGSADADLPGLAVSVARLEPTSRDGAGVAIFTLRQNQDDGIEVPRQSPSS